MNDFIKQLKDIGVKHSIKKNTDSQVALVQTNVLEYGYQFIQKTDWFNWN